MSNNLEFEPDIACDLCGEIGSYDVMGDYICPFCLQATADAEGMLEEMQNEQWAEEDSSW